MIPRRSRGWLFAGASIFAGIGLPGKTPLVAAMLHLPTTLVWGGLALLVCMPLLWIASLRWRNVVAVVAAVLFVATMFGGYRNMQTLHQQGRGSDQADCVVVGSHLLAHGQWPYQPAKLWTGNAMSCGPGWMALQMPATVIAGYPVNLVLMWLASVAVVTWCAGSRIAIAWIALLAVAPVCTLGLFDGSDFLTFGVLSTALLALVEQPGRLAWAKLPVVIMASLIDQFRLPAMVLPALLRSAVGRWLSLGGVILTLLWQLLFFRWNAASFKEDGPWHILRKLRSLPGFALVSAGPAVVFAVLVLLALVLLWLAGRWPARRLYLLFFTAVFGLPAVLDLPKKLAEVGNIAGMLRTWEGGLWLCGMLPMLAYCALVAEPSSVAGTQTVS